MWGKGNYSLFTDEATDLGESELSANQAIQRKDPASSISSSRGASTWQTPGLLFRGFPKRGPQTCSSFTWGLVRNASCQALAPRPPDSDTQSTGPSNLCFHFPSRRFWCTQNGVRSLVSMVDRAACSWEGLIQVPQSTETKVKGKSHSETLRSKVSKNLESSVPAMDRPLMESPPLSCFLKEPRALRPQLGRIGPWLQYHASQLCPQRA